MNRNEMLQAITQILRDILNNPDLKVNENTSAMNVERWDSLAHVNILMTVERTFGVRFSLGEIKQLRNVGEMMRLIEEKKKG